MTRKSTIGAAVAVAALALAAGSTGAYATPTAGATSAQGDIEFGDVVLETYFDLENTTPNPVSLADLTLVACVGADNETPLSPVTYGENDEIAGNWFVRTADPSYTGSADYIADLSWLNSSDYDLRLVDLGAFPATVVAHTTNGSPNADCVAILDSL